MKTYVATEELRQALARLHKSGEWTALDDLDIGVSEEEVEEPSDTDDDDIEENAVNADY